MAEELGGLEPLEELQKHEDEDVYQGALNLLTRHFASEEEPEGP